MIMRVPEAAPRSMWDVAVRAVARALEERAPEAAASIGFFTVFSFFPLILVVVAVGSAVLSNWHTQEQILTTVLRFVPVSRELVSRNLLAVLHARGAVGALGAAGLVWAATSAFAVFLGNLSRAWPCAKPRSALGARAMALVVVGGLVLTVALFLAARTAAAMAHNWGWLSTAFATFAGVVQLAWRMGAVGVIFLGLVLLYRWVPTTHVRWRDAAAGALVSSLAFLAVTAGFTWYIESRFAAYNVVYGSLGALVALLTWVYLLALIALFGGHVAAAAALVESPRDVRKKENG